MLYNPGQNIFRILVTIPIFFSTQVKRNTVARNNHSIYELPPELQNDLRLRILGNKETLQKFQNLIKL